MSTRRPTKQNERSTLILLIEDEAGDRELLAIALERGAQHCTLTAVADGANALHYLRQEAPFAGAPRPDLVILDLNLPGISGHDVLRQMKTDADLRSIPVLVLSTSYDDRDITAAYAAGASSYIVKPGNFRDFNSIIGSLLEYWLNTATLPGHS